MLASLPATLALNGLKRGDLLLALVGLVAWEADARLARNFIRAISQKPASHTVGLLQPLAQGLFLAGALGGILGPLAGFSRQWKGRALDGGT
jgi:hypothetical protein